MNNCDKVFSFFDKICAVPHGSGNTAGICDLCVDFAEAHGLGYMRDPHNNIIIYVPATQGYGSRKTVIIQGHLDMVCVAESGVDIDFEKTPISIYSEGKYIKARGTTLGADDGIAVAMALALMDADDIPHPPLECVFTSDEEIGMLGAAALDASSLHGKIMLNIDSETEGVFTVGCAGGVICDVHIPVIYSECGGTSYNITVSGLVGGHSGEDIDKGRANANKLLARVLDHVCEKFGCRIGEINGGSKDNVIPVRAEACVSAAADISECADLFTAVFRNEFRSTDKDITVSVVRAEKDMHYAFDISSTKHVCDLLMAAPNGIYSMEPDMPDAVRTSLNLGTVRSKDGYVSLSFLPRSSSASEKEYIKRSLSSLADMCGASVSYKGDYPGWEYNEQSHLLPLMVSVFKEQYGHEPRVESIHAGVECGVFAQKISGLDCVSFGPDLLGIHTANERMDIESTKRVWNFLITVLGRI